MNDASELGRGHCKPFDGLTHLKAIPISTPVELREKFEEVKRGFSGLTDWQGWNASMRKIAEIASGNLCENPSFVKQFVHVLRSEINDSIVLHIKSLRSAVTREAGRMVSVVATMLKGDFSPLAEAWLPALLGNTVNKKEIISASSHYAIEDIIKACPDGYPSLLPILVDSVKSTNKTIRSKSLQYIFQALCIWSQDQAFSSSMTRLVEAVRMTVSDADAITRLAARNVFCTLSIRFPEVAEGILSNVDPRRHREMIIELDSFDRARVISYNKESPTPMKANKIDKTQVASNISVRSSATPTEIKKTTVASRSDRASPSTATLSASTTATLSASTTSASSPRSTVKSSEVQSKSTSAKRVIAAPVRILKRSRPATFLATVDENAELAGKHDSVEASPIIASKISGPRRVRLSISVPAPEPKNEMKMGARRILRRKSSVRVPLTEIIPNLSPEKPVSPPSSTFTVEEEKIPESNLSTEAVQEVSSSSTLLLEINSIDCAQKSVVLLVTEATPEVFKANFEQTFAILRSGFNDSNSDSWLRRSILRSIDMLINHCPSWADKILREVILFLLMSCNDHCELVRAVAHKILTDFAQKAENPEQVIKCLVSNGDLGSRAALLLPYLRVILELVPRLGSEYINSALHSGPVLDILISALNHRDIMIRGTSNCIAVELFKVSGQELMNCLSGLPTAKRRILDIHIEKSECKRNCRDVI